MKTQSIILSDKSSAPEALTKRAPASWTAADLCRFSFALAVALIWIVALPKAQAAPPEAMTYQGYLVDANGNPLATNNPANYPVIFRIFPAATGGASLWSEQQIVTVDNGNFSVILSEGTPVGAEPKVPLSVVMGTNGADRYIQLSVTISGSTLDMLPRMRLLPSPYAFLSTSASQLVNPSGAAVVTYANSRVEVNGNMFASGTISGNGSGLTGLTAGQIPNVDASKITSGTLSDARLSANVALLADNNAFVGNQTISGNLGLGTLNTTFPLTIGNNTLGDKISLWGQSGNSFGFGIGPGLLQIHTSEATSDIAFGSGSSAAFAEGVRITGDGNVGIGTNNPTARLEVNGGIKVDGANVLEFGANVAGKEVAAGKIGYGAYTADTLDIVGAGTTVANRKVKVHAEGGTDFAGPISFNGEKPFHFQKFILSPGTTSANTGWSTSNFTVCVVGFRALAGDINEGGVVDPIEVYAVRGGGLWYIAANFATHGTPPERWEIQVMRISNGLVTSNSDFFP